ncbi:hypothetical protein PIB30_013902 [Stylosanthes scabra]|uniref:Aminotransferase-like plant mobile domain-containing protein n=1 Tax=Stylosanthes scabra TaxID=79078 RepID=A0ABU6W661_9FABA|nr:hypothetical protein [Stylosanthes scabra]
MVWLRERLQHIPVDADPDTLRQYARCYIMLFIGGYLMPDKSGNLIRWTPYDTPGIQALIPDWMRSQGEVHTWRSAVPVVCFNFVGMHHIDRVIRQYGGEQPVPRHPVDVTRFMNNTARGDDVWWPTRLQTWYDGWGRRRSPEVMITVHACGDQRGTRQYYDWYVGAAAGIRFLTRAVDLNDPVGTWLHLIYLLSLFMPEMNMAPPDLNDPRWNMAPPDRHVSPPSTLIAVL